MFSYLALLVLLKAGLCVTFQAPKVSHAGCGSGGDGRARAVTPMCRFPVPLCPSPWAFSCTEQTAQVGTATFSFTLLNDLKVLVQRLVKAAIVPSSILESN